MKSLVHLVRGLVVGTALGFPASEAVAQELPIFDAHVHYSHDAWERVPPKEAIAILRKAVVWAWQHGILWSTITH